VNLKLRTLVRCQFENPDFRFDDFLLICHLSAPCWFILSFYSTSVRFYLDYYIDISAGFGYTVGIKADGTVITAGNKDKGQCETQHWQDIIAVSAGMAHTVGLKADGTVVVTGSNDFGQCNVQNWRNYIAVCAGLFNTVGLKADGTVVVCGENKFGQCNNQSWRNIGLIRD